MSSGWFFWPISRWTVTKNPWVVIRGLIWFRNYGLTRPVGTPMNQPVSRYDRWVPFLFLKIDPMVSTHHFCCGKSPVKSLSHPPLRSPKRRNRTTYSSHGVKYPVYTWWFTVGYGFVPWSKHGEDFPRLFWVSNPAIHIEFPWDMAGPAGVFRSQGADQLGVS